MCKLMGGLFRVSFPLRSLARKQIRVFHSSLPGCFFFAVIHTVDTGRPVKVALPRSIEDRSRRGLISAEPQVVPRLAPNPAFESIPSDGSPSPPGTICDSRETELDTEFAIASQCGGNIRILRDAKLINSVKLNWHTRQLFRQHGSLRA